MKAYYVYMMTNRSRVVLYTGVTNSLERRLWFHRNVLQRSTESIDSFTTKHSVILATQFPEKRKSKVGVGKRKMT